MRLSLGKNLLLGPISMQKVKKYLDDLKKVAHAGKRLFFYVAKKSPGFMLLYIITITLFSLIPFINSWVGSKVIDELINSIGNAGRDLTTLYRLVIIGVIVSVADSLVDILNVIAEANIWFKVGRDIDLDVAKKFAYLDYEYFDDPEINDKINNVRQNMQAKPQRFVTNLLRILESLVTIISATIIFITFSPLIILIMLVTSIPILIVNMVYGRRSWGIWAAKGDVSRDFYWTKSYLQNEGDLAEVKIFRIRRYLIQKVMDIYNNFQKEQLDIENKRNAVLFGLSIFRLIGRTAAYLMIVSIVLAGKITIGQFNFYTGAVGRLQRGFGGLLRQIAQLYEDGLYIVDMYEFLDLPEKLKPGSVCLPDSTTPPKIEIKGLSFDYPIKKDEKEINALKNIDMTINPGEHIAIVGENGAGKTTLIRLLMRFYDPKGGQILINGIDLRDLDIENWYKNVGTLFQAYNLYHFSAEENIGVGDIDSMEDHEKIVGAAKNSGAHEFIDKYENKYGQLLSKRFKGGINPSSGQSQKIALARSFFKDAPILILDEPTSAIDPKAEYEIFQHLFEFAKGKTVIIISHRFSTVRNASKIYVLKEGSVEEQGSHEELMNIDGGIYKTAFELQKKGYE